ncbi:MAG: toxin-activating lysine-acyltransferase [Rhodobacteraceae bacterium]|nr:toxin-activating lysine-acyltransferase [Paracoccaceae bacterium]
MGIDHGNLLGRTLRHVQVLAQPGFEAEANAPPLPPGWFDLPQAMWADLGVMAYLLSLTGYHRKKPMAEIMALLEPPLRLGQYRIFRTEQGHPRAFLTWAGLSPAAEYDFAIRHRALLPDEWASGPSKWLVNLAAPFGHLPEIIPLLTANPRETRVRALWHNRSGDRYRILEWSRPLGETEVRVASYGVAQFVAKLGVV